MTLSSIINGNELQQLFLSNLFGLQSLKGVLISFAGNKDIYSINKKSLNNCINNLNNNNFNGLSKQLKSVSIPLNLFSFEFVNTFINCLPLNNKNYKLKKLTFTQKSQIYSIKEKHCKLLLKCIKITKKRITFPEIPLKDFIIFMDYVKIQLKTTNHSNGTTTNDNTNDNKNDTNEINNKNEISKYHLDIIFSSNNFDTGISDDYLINFLYKMNFEFHNLLKEISKTINWVSKIYIVNKRNEKLTINLKNVKNELKKKKNINMTTIRLFESIKGESIWIMCCSPFERGFKWLSHNFDNYKVI